MIHPSTPASTKTVLIPLPAQPAAGGAAYPAFPGRGPDALPVPLSMESSGVLGDRQPAQQQALDAWTGAVCTQNGVPGGFFRTHLPVGFSPGLCEVAVPDGYPMAGQRVQFMIHPSTPASTKTVLIPLPAQPAAGGAAYPAFPQPGVPLSSQAFRPPASAPGPPGMAPPITQNHMAGPGPSQPAQFGHPDGFGKAAIFMAVDDASHIKTVHDVKPFALKLCYGGAAKKRWYFKIQENRLENNRPLFLWPLCCMESCICDWTNVKYFDKLGYNLCCVIPCPGHLVSYKETIYCCFCCDCHCCYDAFCRYRCQSSCTKHFLIA